MTEAQMLDLYKTGSKYRKELLAMPLAQLGPIISHMTLRLGVRGKESVGELSTDAEIRPYRSAKGDTDNTSIVLRELETYLGDVVKEFDPHALASTVYGNGISTSPTSTDITRSIAMEMAKVASNRLATNLFTAVRNASGDKTNDLFNGFATIVNSEVAASNLAESKGNLATLGEVTTANIVDVLMSMYQDAASDELQEQKTKMFLPRNIYNMYTRAYSAEFGAVAFNKEYNKTYLEGTSNLCELVPLSGMRSTNTIILTTKSNMLIGVDQMSDTETVRVRECDNPKMAQFFMKLYFGVQFETISKQRLCVGKFTIPSA